MNIAVRMEGGLGDHLLANRLVFAIRDKYPDAKIFAFSDTEGNPSSRDFLLQLFPDVYEQFTVMDGRKSKEYEIESQFGIENWPASMKNVKDEYLAEFAKADRFYNLHIDSLDFTKHDYDWLRYFYHFPRPKIQLNRVVETVDKFVACHLYARPDSPANLDRWYVKTLLKKIAEKIPVIAITTEEHLKFYSGMSEEISNLLVVPCSLINATKIINDSSAFIGIDSGIRYLPYHFSKPTFVFSKYCQQRGRVASSHVLRWLLMEKNVFPEYHDAGEVAQIVANAANDPTYSLFPISGPLDNVVVRRND